MKSIALCAAAASLAATSIHAEPAKSTRMSQEEVSRELSISTMDQQVSSSAILVPLLMLALIAAAAASAGGDGYHLVEGTSEAFSDARLKTDVSRIGTSPDGIGIYRFRYRDDSTMFIGALAQDVLQHRPDAVRTADNGYLMVDYSKIDVIPKLAP